MIKTTLEQWRLFKAVADHGGFNQASEIVHKSQSTIHHAVRKLEELLGVKLFAVKGRKASLTPAGDLMLRRANYLLDEAAKIEAVAGTLSAGVESRLDIAVDEAFPQQQLYKVLDTVSAQYPQLCIELRETVLSGANELLQLDNVDISLSPIPAQGGFNEEICQIAFVAVANPAHALLHLERELSFEDLKSHRQIVVRDSAMTMNKDDGWLRAEQRWAVSHIRTSIDLISKGFGYAWLPEPGISDQLAQGTLTPLPLAHGARRSVRFYLNFSDADKLGPAARSFIGELRYQTQHLYTSDVEF